MWGAARIMYSVLLKNACVDHILNGPSSTTHSSDHSFPRSLLVSSPLPYFPLPHFHTISPLLRPPITSTTTPRTTAKPFTITRTLQPTPSTTVYHHLPPPLLHHTQVPSILPEIRSKPDRCRKFWLPPSEDGPCQRFILDDLEDECVEGLLPLVMENTHPTPSSSTPSSSSSSSSPSSSSSVAASDHCPLYARSRTCAAQWRTLFKLVEDGSCGKEHQALASPLLSHRYQNGKTLFAMLVDLAQGFGDQCLNGVHSGRGGTSVSSASVSSASSSAAPVSSFLPAMFTSFNNQFVQDLFRHRLTQHPTTTAAVAAVAAAATATAVGTPTNCGATTSLKGVDCTAGGTIQGAQCVWKGRYVEVFVIIIFSVWREICTLRNEKFHRVR